MKVGSRGRVGSGAVLLLAVFGVAGAARGSQEQAGIPPRAGSPEKAAVKIAPDIKAEALWDARKTVPFRALDNPPMVKAADADSLGDEEYVLALTVNGESRAYPTRFIWWHHVVNDEIGKPENGVKAPVAITYCSVCNTGIRFDTILDGKPVKLDFYGLYNGVASFCDRATGSVLLQVDGRLVTGPLLGKSLKTGALLDTTWGRWKKLHPDTLVMSPNTAFSDVYAPKGVAERRGYDRFPAPFFRPTVTRGDLRLPPFQKVLGVSLAQPPADTTRDAPPTGTVLRRAYPVAALQEAGGVVNDTLGDAPVTVFFEPETATASAFSRSLDSKTLTFEVRKTGDGTPAFYDKETGSRWNIEGGAEEGMLSGKSLVRLQNHLSQWYGWVSYFPETTIFGRTDPPQPGNPFGPSPSAPAVAPPPSRPAEGAAAGSIGETVKP